MNQKKRKIEKQDRIVESNLISENNRREIELDKEKKGEKKKFEKAWHKKRLDQIAQKEQRKASERR